MDLQIMRAILRSHGEVKNAKSSTGSDHYPDEEKFPPTDPTVLAALSDTFGDLISHKVSPDAYQRYAVRIHLIDVLRDWIRPRKELDCSRTFFRGETALNFVSGLASEYLSEEFLREYEDSDDALVNLAGALMLLIPRKKCLIRHLERILERMCEIRRSRASDDLMERLATEKDHWGLGATIVGKLYVALSAKLVEAPILEHLTKFLKAAETEFPSSSQIDQIMNVSVCSPMVFHTTCSVLKEIFIATEHSPRVLNYIGRYHERLASLCERSGKNILDLYPLRFQALVIMLKIEARYHTSNSLEHAIESLAHARDTDPEEIFILMTHFPGWLHTLADRIDAQCKPSAEICDASRMDDETSSVEWL